MDTSRYVSLLRDLPVNPAIAAKVLDMMQKQDFSFKKLEDIISADPGLTMKILKIANSALYARQSKVTKLQNAITLLGINTIKNLVILVTGASLFKQNVKSRFYALFWHHSLASAFISRDLAIKLGYANQAEEAFIAGLLHNVGQVALYLADPGAYEALVQELVQGGCRYSELELAAYGATHREVGADLLTQWSFPDVYCDCAREHGNANITSSWKQVILFVSVGSFIASNWFYFTENPKPYELLRPVLVYLGLEPEGIGSFESSYRTVLAKDGFYQECQNLIMA